METTPNATENAPTSHAPDPEALAPGQLVRQAQRLVDQAQRLLTQAVIAERSKGTSWETVGEALHGVTKSAAQKRYGSIVSDWTHRLVDKAVKSADPDADPDGLSMGRPVFLDAYKEYWGEWQQVAEIVAAQDRIVELSNATTAASGAGPEPKSHTGSYYSGTMIKPLFTFDPSTAYPPYQPLCRDCHDQIGEQRNRRSAQMAKGAAAVQEILEQSGSQKLTQLDDIEKAMEQYVRRQAQEPEPLSLEQRVGRLERLFSRALCEETRRESRRDRPLTESVASGPPSNSERHTGKEQQFLDAIRQVLDTL